VLESLRARGWGLRPSEDPRALREVLSARYSAVPEALLAFLVAVSGAVSPDTSTWFLNAADYEGSSDSAFEWNAWEQLSLEAAEGDEQLRSQIEAFWAAHVPFLLSVRDGYSYIALALAGPNASSVVAGREPEFEEVTVLAPSIEAFSAQMRSMLVGDPVDEVVARVLFGSDAG